MAKPRTIAFLLSVLITGLTGLVFYFFGEFQSDTIVKVLVFQFAITLIVLYIVVRYSVFSEIDKLLETLEGIRKNDFSYKPPSKRSTYHPLKKMRREVYRLAILDKREIEHFKKLSAFRKEFVADISHELKTPLFAAQGFVHTLLDGADEDEVIRKRFLNRAAKSLDSLDILIQDLLTLSQIEIGEVKMQFEYFELNKLAAELIEQLENKASAKGISLGFDGEYPQPVIVFADYLRMKQVLTNLISNGIKYNKEGGEVKIGFLSDINSVSVFVKDTGEGIPDEDLDRVFERFYRVEKSRSREKGGTGLGLSIVKHILEGHKSKITVTSTLGEGSVFNFKLPKGKTDALFK